MKKATSLLAAALFAIAIQSPAVAAAPSAADELERSTATLVTTAQWDAFSDRLVEALASDNASLQQAALRLVIKHGASLDVRKGVFDVARMYRDGSDAQVRRMAVVALSRMNSAWAIDYLERSVAYEKNEQVRHTIAAVLAASEA